MDAEPEDPLERRRDELRRIVYGTPGEPPPEHVVAELAAVEREIAERDDPADAAASEVSDSPARDADDAPDVPAGRVDDVTEAPPPDPDGAPDEAPSAAPPSRPPGRRLLVAVLAGIALIIAGVAVIGPTRELLSPPRGLDVFDREPTVEELELADQVAVAAGLRPGDAATLRAVGRVFGHSFWVYRDGADVCLLSQREYWFEWVRTCAPVDEFRETGLTRPIAGDDIRDAERPPRIRPDDLVLVTWGPGSIEVEWRVEPSS